MAILGIGTDIVQIERIRQILARHPERFAARLLHESELSEFRKAGNPAAFIAKRFAAKEAAAKALGTGISRGIAFTDFRVRHTEAGQPQLEVGGRAAEIVAKMGGATVHLSISDEAEHALAFAVLESA